MRADRPTWTLGEQTLAATYPARDVDLDEAFLRAMSFERHHSRMNEVTDLIKQMAAFHIEAAGDTYTGLAMMARGPGVTPWNGWHAEIFGCDVAGATELLLTRKDAPGGIHLSIRNEPVLEAASAERVKELQTAITQELDALGVTERGRILRDLFPQDDETPSEALLKEFKDQSQSYRTPRDGDKFDRLIATIVNIKGTPAGIPGSDGSKLSDFAGRDVDRDYFSGEQLSISRDIYTRDDDILSVSNARIGGSADFVLQVLSGILEANGFAPVIADASEKTADLAWRAYGDEHSAEIMDVANAAIYRSKGLFDEACAAQVTRYSRAIAAMDVAGISDLLEPLARGLIEKGFENTSNAFDANDMRDIAHATTQDGILQLFSETQNGTYRMDIQFDDTGDVHRLDAQVTHSGKDVPVGRFLRQEECWIEDYEGKITGADPIAHDIKAIRHMNNLISSLSSLSCVFEDEYKEDSPEP